MSTSTTKLEPINLQRGWPSKRLFPSHAIHAASTTTLLDPDIAGEALVYGADSGYGPLHESLASWLTAFYRPSAGPIGNDCIFIGCGASGTLGIMLQKFTDPLYTKRVFMVEPTYFLACPIFEDSGFQRRLQGVPEDEEGVDVEFLRRELEVAEKERKKENESRSGFDVDRLKDEKKYPKLYRYVIYAVPTFSNPTGKVMSSRRRKELVLLAREFDALVLTDDVYDMLRWPTDPKVPIEDLPSPPPRIVDLDRELPGQNKYGNAVSNGSFSKIVAPGTRVSWVEGTKDFIWTLSLHGATKSGGCPSHMASVFMDQMVRSGSLHKHITEVLVPTYRKRYAVLMDAIQEHLAPLGVEMPLGQTYDHGSAAGYASIEEAGGFFTWFSLPNDFESSAKVAEKALELYDLRFAHGGMMVAFGDDSSLERARTSFGRGVRLSWSWLEESEIREGIERLAQVIKGVRDGTIKK